MLRGPLHHKGANGRCEECLEPFPCPTGITRLRCVIERSPLVAAAARVRKR
jgi:hypothetical protein